MNILHLDDEGCAGFQHPSDFVIDRPKTERKGRYFFSDAG